MHATGLRRSQREESDNAQKVGRCGQRHANCGTGRWGCRAACPGIAFPIAYKKASRRKDLERLSRQCWAGLHRSLPAKPRRAMLVGIPPGEADLLTLNAISALQPAEAILFDNLVSQDVLKLAQREEKRRVVGKRGG